MNTTFTLDQAADAAACFHAHGYAVFKGVFTAGEIAAAKAATDRVKQRGYDVGRSFRHGNLVYWLRDEPNVGTNVIGMQWPSYLEPCLEAMRRDPRLLQILRPLIGDNARQIINQLHWKTPGSTFSVNFHRDRENRRPPEAFRELAASYIQTGTCIDPMTEENGALLVIPDSHHNPTPFQRDTPANFGSGDVSDAILRTVGYSADDLRPIYAAPGDLVLWHVDTIHGSGPNHSASMDRCLYINGYVDARHCLRGHWAFIRGQSIPLPPIDVPVLVQFEEIFDRLELEVSDAPAKPRD